MVESTWRVDFGPEGRKMWKRMLYDHDPVIATDAVAQLSQRQRERPTVADLRGMIQKIVRDRMPPGLPEPKGKAAPEWAWVWSWCRFFRQPRFLIPFPQQEPHVDSSETIAIAKYEELLAEWTEAGKPKRSHVIPTVVLRT
jgi:hypothetical protein